METGSQQISTKANKHHPSDRILEFLESSGEEHNAKDIRQKCKEPYIPHGTVRFWLSKLTKDGKIQRPHRGFYKANSTIPVHEKLALPPRVHYIQLYKKSTNMGGLPPLKGKGERLSLPWGGEAYIQCGKNGGVTVSITREYPGYRGQELLQAVGYVEGWLGAQGITVELYKAEVTQDALNWDSKLPKGYEVALKRLEFDKWFLGQYGYEIGGEYYQRVEIHEAHPRPFTELIDLTMGGMTMNQIANFFPAFLGQVRASIEEGFKNVVEYVEQRLGGGG